MYENIKLNSLIIEITDNCNLNCKHCFKSGGHGEEMSIELLEKIIEEAVGYGVKEISLSGGECLLHPRLFDIIQMIKKYSNVKFGFLTNGMLLNQEFLDEIEKLPDCCVQISADGSKKDIYESIRGEGTFENYMAALELLSKSKIKDKIARTAISVVNYKDVREICDLVCEKGIAPSFIFVVKLGNAVENWDSLELNNVQKIHVNNVIKKYNNERGTRISLLYPGGRCGFSYGEERDIFTVGADGNVYVCDYLKDMPIGNLKENTLKDIIRGKVMQDIHEFAESRAKKMEESEMCSSCGVFTECTYGCPADAMHENVEALCDSQCAYRRLFYGCMMADLM